MNLLALNFLYSCAKFTFRQDWTLYMAKKFIHNFFYYWFPVIIYCLVIFIQSSYPVPKETPDWPFKDKVLHLAGYSVLGVLFLRGFRNSRLKNRHKLIIVISILFTGIYGLTDEWHQYYVPLRSAEALDLLADFLGGMFGVYFYHRILEKYPVIGRL
ncbi:MAG: hypothetical protein DRH15_05605 [Deltaproteobacteria bacterium]|nr:MAG: hypothetical protein DRH15_05605 [Deltaproteobacteria bacterium]